MHVSTIFGSIKNDKFFISHFVLPQFKVKEVKGQIFFSTNEAKQVKNWNKCNTSFVLFEFLFNVYM